MVQVDGYKVVPLRLSPNATDCHSVYMREHFIRLMDPNKPKGRTLFLLNVPPYVTESSLEIFFKRSGKIETVSFAAKPGRDKTDSWQELSNVPFSVEYAPFQFKVAYVVFQKNSSLVRALTFDSIDLYSSTNGECYIKSGMDLWHSEYESYVLNIDQTQALIDTYMNDYDKRELKVAEAAKITATDADGWVTVGKEGRNAGFEQTETVIGRLENKIAKGKKTNELKNFYTFQIREAKMQNIAELRKKYEEDKRKIELIKQSRRFRPF